MSAGILASSQSLDVIYFGFIYFIDYFAGGLHQRQICWSQQKQAKKENKRLKSVPLLLLPVYLVQTLLQQYNTVSLSKTMFSLSRVYLHM